MAKPAGDMGVGTTGMAGSPVRVAVLVGVLAWISTAPNSPDKGASRGLAGYAVSSSVAPFHQGTATWF